MSARLFITEATAIVRRHRRRFGPLFLMLALQDVHSPYQVEERYSSLYNHTSLWQRTWAGMVSRMDACVGMLVVSLRKAHMWPTTLFVFVSDSAPSVPGARGALARSHARLPRPCVRPQMGAPSVGGSLAGRTPLFVAARAPCGRAACAPSA